jgi:hypothetical protein
VRSVQWAARQGHDGFAPEAQTEETLGGDAGDHLIEAGSK